MQNLECTVAFLSLHRITGVVRTLHLKSSFNHGVEVVIHFYSRVWSHAYREKQEALFVVLDWILFVVLANVA